jgi:hypothetical protein
MILLQEKPSQQEDVARLPWVTVGRYETAQVAEWTSIPLCFKNPLMQYRTFNETTGDITGETFGRKNTRVAYTVRAQEVLSATPLQGAIT